MTGGRAFPMVTLAQWSIAGLDQRFHVSTRVPPAEVGAGIVLVTIGGGLFTWSSLVNPFFVPEVRIHAERGQQVIHTGPSTIVRYPRYARLLLLVAAKGLALNSPLAVIATVIFAAVLVWDTVIDDQLLQDELAGYADYAGQVRYRLVPDLG